MICIENGKVIEWSDYRLNETKRIYRHLTLRKKKVRQMLSVNNNNKKKKTKVVSCEASKGVEKCGLVLSFLIRWQSFAYGYHQSTSHKP